MRAIWTAGACMLALALSGIGASVASAETEYPLTGLPELGRCVKVATGTGNFSYSNCITVDKDGHDGNYEWKPGPGENGTFKAQLNSIVVETVSRAKISCALGFLTGQFTNGKELKVTETVLEGCTNVHTNKACFSSPLEKGKIVSTQTLVGTIGFIPNPTNPGSPYVGTDLKAESELLPLLSFTCGEETLGGESVALEDSVIGKFSKPNTMLTERGLIYSQKRGHQKPEAFEGGVKDTITETVTPLSNPLAKTSEQAGLAAGGPFLTGEAIEFKSKQK